MTILIAGIQYKVDMVNYCRARCIPVGKQRVKFKTVMGQAVEFSKDRPAINIAPNSEVPILSWERGDA